MESLAVSDFLAIELLAVLVLSVPSRRLLGKVLGKVLGRPQFELLGLRHTYAGTAQ